MSRNVSDERIISALLASNTVSDAADSLGISSRTIFRRLEDDWFFRQSLEEAIEAVRQARRAEALYLVDDAFTTLRETMRDASAPPSVRLRAAEIALGKFWGR